MIKLKGKVQTMSFRKLFLYTICALSLGSQEWVLAEDATKTDDVQVTTEVTGLTKKQKLLRMQAQIAEELEHNSEGVENGETTTVILDDETTEEPPQDEDTKKAVAIAKFSAYVGAIHTLYARGWDSSWIEFEDGSSWKIRWDDRHLIQHWLPTDKLIVCQAGWFKAFDFVVVNLDHFNDEIYADLPLVSSNDHIVGSYTRYIKAIDFNSGMIWLNDGSSWLVYHRDSSWLYDWHPGEIVVIGINKGWGQDAAPYILINRKLRDYVRCNLH